MSRGRQLLAATITTLLAISVVASVALADSQAVRDSEGRVIGYLEHSGDKTYVRDCDHRLLGHSDAHGTYDAVGRKVSGQSVPDMLLGDSACMKSPTVKRGPGGGYKPRVFHQCDHLPQSVIVIGANPTPKMLAMASELGFHGYCSTGVGLVCSTFD